LKVIARDTLSRPDMPRTNSKFERGFTLVEAVVVIVITGIVAGMVALFIRLPVKGYIDSEARAELTSTAATAFQRMSRDLRLALPNSIRTTSAGGNQYIEFLLTKTAGRYLAVQDSPTSGAVLSFTNSSLASFDVLNPMPAGEQAIVPGDFIVIYNTGSSSTHTDAYACNGSPPCNRARVNGVAVNTVNGVAVNTITLANNVNLFAGLLAPASTSPGRGFQVVTSAVTYLCNPSAGTLRRYWYDVNWSNGTDSTQPTDTSVEPLSGASSAVLATGVTACSFSYDAAAGSPANPQIGLVDLSLKMRAAGTEQITLLQQVYVDHTP
jgi:MSHA biogenesis protein MshO